MPGKLNIVAFLLSRPPQAVPAPGPATTAGVKVPSWLLAVPQVAGGTAGASPAAAVAAVAVEGVDLSALARDQSTCHVTQQLLSSSSLVIQSLPDGHQKLLCDMSIGRP